MGSLATDAIAQMAESQIRKALHDGTLQGLRGEGKPLSETHITTATHYGGVEQVCRCIDCDAYNELSVIGLYRRMPS